VNSMIDAPLLSFIAQRNDSEHCHQANTKLQTQDDAIVPLLATKLRSTKD